MINVPLANLSVQFNMPAPSAFAKVKIKMKRKEALVLIFSYVAHLHTKVKHSLVQPYFALLRNTAVFVGFVENFDILCAGELIE